MSDALLTDPRLTVAAYASDEDHGGPGSVIVRLGDETLTRLSYAQARELHDALRVLVTRQAPARSFVRSYEGEKAWLQHCARLDAQPHDRAVLDFAERWGAEMERRIDAVIGPPTVADVAYDASQAAGVRKITGQQMRLASHLLCETWERGAELREWLDS